MTTEHPLEARMDEARISQLWRYPVKSLRGEALVAAELTLDGIAGDRIVHVAGTRGLLTGRTRHGLLSIPASTGPDGVPHVDGHPWSSTHAAEVIRARGGPGAHLVADETAERFDVLNLLVATDGAVQHFGYDIRRLRPNIVLSGIDVELDSDLPGSALYVGDALIGVHSVRDRCIVTTIDPDSGEQDLDVLRRIRHEFGGRIALNCWVIRAGAVNVGDTVTILPATEGPAQIGGWVVGAPYPHIPSGDFLSNG
jgi:uncharacterized protein YcbX